MQNPIPPPRQHRCLITQITSAGMVMTGLSGYSSREKLIKFMSLVHASSGFSWSSHLSWADRELFETRNQMVFSAFVSSFSYKKLLHSRYSFLGNPCERHNFMICAK